MAESIPHQCDRLHQSALRAAELMKKRGGGKIITMFVSGLARIR